ncbi:MAG: hypothetical protein QOK29_4608 [Rhodospirillaceae bacterium]|jgi:hypothetical protein|nr:hypothetical protein [Rhodospirillaceae bacterium]
MEEMGVIEAGLTSDSGLYVIGACLVGAALALSFCAGGSSRASCLKQMEGR